VSDVTPETELPEEFLHENVHKLLPTLDSILFAVDATQEENDDAGDQVETEPEKYRHLNNAHTRRDKSNHIRKYLNLMSFS
jgi:hypothetical protein